MTKIPKILRCTGYAEPEKKAGGWIILSTFQNLVDGTKHQGITKVSEGAMEDPEVMLRELEEEGLAVGCLFEERAVPFSTGEFEPISKRKAYAMMTVYEKEVSRLTNALWDEARDEAKMFLDEHPKTVAPKKVLG
jgi:hypothetical protein